MRSIERLCARNFDELHPDVSRPRFERGAMRTGLVHLGVGAFMRSHIAEYQDEALAAEGGDWAITGVSLRHPDVRDRLGPQDGLYILGARDGQRESRRLIGSLRSVLVAPENPSSVLRLLSDASVRVITLTVTEKGYCLDPSSGDLQIDHADVRHDLRNPEEPRSTIGYLVAALAARRKTSARPPTIVSCDNLPSNGTLLRTAVLQFARAHDPALESWIADNVTFPLTMVDRIVPATTDFDIAQNANAVGLYDEAYVKTEPFSQWVIQDAFCNERPAWEAGGALLVKNVAPFESAKLQLLNGPHSAIAYLGYLAGFEYVHEAMADAMFNAFIRQMMKNDIAPVAPEPREMDHSVYIEELLQRFANPALQHRTWQIAMDGSQKLPQRILSTVRAQLERGGPVASLGLVVAAWMRYALGQDERARPIDVRDPLVDKFAAIAAEGPDNPTAVADRFLAIREVFGSDLPAEPRFRSTVTESLRQLLENGAAHAICQFVRLDGTA